MYQCNIGPYFFTVSVDIECMHSCSKVWAQSKIFLMLIKVDLHLFDQKYSNIVKYYYNFK